MDSQSWVIAAVLEVSATNQDRGIKIWAHEIDITDVQLASAEAMTTACNSGALTC